MPRILGVDIPKEKKARASLCYIYGIGRVLSGDILKAAGVDPDKRAKSLTEEEVSKITAVIQKEYKIEGDVRRDVSQNIKRLMDIGSYRGMRHKRSLPARGQRSRTNARTRKGPKRSIATIKVKAAAPAVPAAKE